MPWVRRKKPFRYVRNQYVAKGVDLRLHGLVELRERYYLVHPVLMAECSSGALNPTIRDLAKRLYCGKSAMQRFAETSTGAAFIDELRHAYKTRHLNDDFDTAEILTARPAGYELL